MLGSLVAERTDAVLVICEPGAAIMVATILMFAPPPFGRVPKLQVSVPLAKEQFCCGWDARALTKLMPR